MNMLRNNGTLQNVWFSKGIQAVSGTVWGSTQNIRHYFSLKKRNDVLAEENHRLRVRLAEIEAQTGKTQAYPEDGIAGGFRYIPATIVKISNNTLHNYMIIGKGSEDGVSKGAGVVTGQGAVGVIDAVSRNFSYARSFKNHEMNISARLGEEGAVGPMSWDGLSSDGAILREIPLHVEFEKGDTVYTSGFSSIFPADIPVGIIERTEDSDDGMFAQARVELFTNFATLRKVYIVGNEGRKEQWELENSISKE